MTRGLPDFGWTLWILWFTALPCLFFQFVHALCQAVSHCLCWFCAVSLRGFLARFCYVSVVWTCGLCLRFFCHTPVLNSEFHGVAFPRSFSSAVPLPYRRLARVLWIWCWCLDFGAVRECQFTLEPQNVYSFHLMRKNACSLAMGSDVRFAIAVFFRMLRFDASLGFPGEGHKNWTFLSSNVTSLSTNHIWKTWNETVLCLQETRLGKNNLRTVTTQVQSVGRSLIRGELLPGLLMSNGRTRTQHGGTAILGPPELCSPFDPSDDLTGLYTGLFRTQRVVAAWVQVTKHVKALVFSIYAQTAASALPQVLEANDKLLEDVFTISAQFGSIPVLVAGDLQLLPSQYPSIARAINFLSWVDPLATVNTEGECTRPLTYSRDSSFSGYGEGCSSIDAILVNQVAFAALEEIEVIPLFDCQHRPVKATFQWEKIFQHGYTLHLPAPFDISKVPTKSQKDEYAAFDTFACDAWHGHFKANFEGAATSQDKWKIVSDSLVHALESHGASWQPGAKHRAKPPIFRPKQFCPGQLKSKSAVTLFGSKMKNTIARLWELRCRLERPVGGDVDQAVTCKTADRAWRALRELKSPFLWIFPQFPNLLDVFMNLQWLTNKFQLWEHHCKLQRIQQWKNKIVESSKSTRAFIFQHLRNRAKDEPANLVTDDDGNILFQPNDALRRINTEWDEVFSANCLHEDPVDVLRAVWPYIHHAAEDCHLAPLTAHDLFLTVQQRKSTAAPGLDGWRTVELQSLPPGAFHGVAAFFNWLETSELPLPFSLTTAKQQILNKNGSSSPLQKRLITILPALMLAYSGTRFRQIQPWQNRVLSSSLFGAIKGRNMSSIPTTLKLALDDAEMDGETLAGLKLDKAKCFDRIIPTVAAALFLSFGLPPGLTRVFLKLYSGLRRHLAYKGWVEKAHTTAANGVAQGCSLSLVAINLYMNVWVLLMVNLPNVFLRVFIDDAYLWCKIQHLSELQTAVQITQVWDLMCGQFLNDAKSIIWATDTNGRKLIKSAFPAMKLKLEFDALGSYIQTSRRDAFGVPDSKIMLIATDARNIAALPVSRDTKTLLIGARVLPKCTFSAAINQLPVKAMSKISGAIVSSLWHKKPHWRARWLVFGLLSQPHRVEPEISCAYHGILDFARFLHANPQIHDQCCRQLRLTTPLKHGLLRMVKLHCETLHLCLHDDLTISFRFGQRIPLRLFPPSVLKGVLKRLARHACYCRAADINRKDIFHPQGILDFDLTATFWRRSKLSFEDGLSATTHFESQMVGCTLTRDRLCAAGLIESNLCRFCSSTKESLPHLIFDCPSLKQQLKPLVHHELGANFMNLGLVEHPPKIIEHRLRHFDPQTLPCSQFFPLKPRIDLWTDGSIQWGENFWLMSGGFAVINADAKCVSSGPVCAWDLSSFATELWAIIVAITSSDCPIRIFTDCKGVAVRFESLLTRESVPPNWPMQPWWAFLQRVLQSRKLLHPKPVELCWIPAHKLENMPIEMISQELAFACGTEVRHIHLNRVADLTAKEQSLASSAVWPSLRDEVLNAVLKQQEWLAKLHHHLGGEEKLPSNPTVDLEPVQVPDDKGFDFATAKKLFPLWEWTQCFSAFPWKPKIPKQLPKPKTIKLADECWQQVCGFVDGLCWIVDTERSISYVELAVIFHARGFRLTLDPLTDVTFRDIASWVRRCMSALANSSGTSAFPGVQRADKARSIGKCLPSGIIEGAAPYMRENELVMLASILHSGAGKRFTSWTIPVSSFTV